MTSTPKKPRNKRTLGQIAAEFHAAHDAALNPNTGVVTFAHSPASLRQVGGTHYKQMAVQPWDVVDDWPLEQRIGFYRGGVLKYLMRMGAKDEGALEIAKGQHYMAKLLEVLQEQSAQVAA